MILYMNQLSQSDKKNIIKNIYLLSKNNQKHVLELIYKNNVKFTENKSGCYIKFNDIPNKLLIKIHKYINSNIQKQEIITQLPETIDSNQTNSEIDNLNLTNYQKNILKKDSNIY